MTNLKNPFNSSETISFQIQLYCFPSDMLRVAALAYRVVTPTFFAQIPLFFVVESAFFAPAFRVFKFFIPASIFHCISDFSNAYQLSMLIGHLSALVNDEATAITAEEQEIIDDVFSPACNKDYLWGFGMVVGDENVKKYATFDEKVSRLQKLYIKLILRNPKTFFKDCWQLFKKTSIITHNVGVLCANTSAAFDPGYADIFGTIMSNPYGNYYFHLP